MSKRTILVTGSTGKTGKKTVECLRSEGQEVRALVRGEGAGSEYLKSIGAEVVVGDLMDINSIRAALEGTVAAYSCYPLRPGLIEATAIFAQAAVEAGVGSIVNMSQICARRD